MIPWQATLRLSASEAKLLLISDSGDDLLKARLPIRGLRPNHPRALLTLLEGLALWSGAPLSVAVSVAACWAPSLASDFFEQTVWPEESALVRFVFVAPNKNARRIRGLGDFRDLRRLLLRDVVR